MPRWNVRENIIQQGGYAGRKGRESDWVRGWERGCEDEGEGVLTACRSLSMARRAWSGTGHVQPCPAQCLMPVICQSLSASDSHLRRRGWLMTSQVNCRPAIWATATARVRARAKARRDEPRVSVSGGSTVNEYAFLMHFQAT